MSRGKRLLIEIETNAKIMKTNKCTHLTTFNPPESMINNETAHNGDNDNANELHASAATAPNETISDFLEEYEQMQNEVAPYLEDFQQALSSIGDHKIIAKLYQLFNETLAGLYDEWEELRSHDGSLSDRIREYGGQESVEELRRNIISTEKEFTELVSALEENSRDFWEYCESNCYFREQVSELIDDSLSKFEAKNEKVA